MTRVFKKNFTIIACLLLAAIFLILIQGPCAQWFMPGVLPETNAPQKDSILATENAAKQQDR